MADDVSVHLAKIESALQRLDRTVLQQSLKAGLPASTLHMALGEVGLRVPPELESLYGWRNGTSTVGIVAVDAIQLFPGYYLLSVEDAVANYRAFQTDPRWTAGWLPVFANGGGDFYVLDLNLQGPPVRHFRIEESEHPIEFNSIGAMLTTLASAFERGSSSSTRVATWRRTTSPSESLLAS